MSSSGEGLQGGCCFQGDSQGKDGFVNGKGCIVQGRRISVARTQPEEGAGEFFKVG